MSIRPLPKNCKNGHAYPPGCPRHPVEGWRICEQCEAKKRLRAREKQRAKKKENYRSPLEIFEQRIRKTQTCWVWTGPVSEHGYGLFRGPGISEQAHRWYYRQKVSAIFAGLVVDHLCENKTCVNPAHLEPVTIGENNRRAAERRKKRGFICRDCGDKTFITKRKTSRRCDYCHHRYTTDLRQARRLRQKEEKIAAGTYRPRTAINNCCIRGHEYTPENTYWQKVGYFKKNRSCLACRRMRAKGEIGPPKKPRVKKPVNTHCKRGHEYRPESTYICKYNRRHCRLCMQARELVRRKERSAIKRQQAVESGTYMRPLVGQPYVCRDGHWVKGKNVLIDKNNHRRCRQCRQKTQRKYSYNSRASITKRKWKL